MNPFRDSPSRRITAEPVPPERWVRGPYSEITCLKWSAAELEIRMGVRFWEGVKDGWGAYRAAGFQMPNGRRFGLTQYLTNRPGPVVEVTCLLDEHFSTDFDDVLESLDMDLADIVSVDSGPAIDERVKLVPHSVWRQDDNGSRILVQTFPCRAAATKCMRNLEDFAHKQTYWIEATSETPVAR